jgi:hypothetical protein
MNSSIFLIALWPCGPDGQGPIMQTEAQKTFDSDGTAALKIQILEKRGN